MGKTVTAEQQAPNAAELRARLGKRSIALIGMPGSGKSSIGRRLAPRLGLPFVDADAEIELAAGMSIPEMFAQHGEAYFRAGEARVIARLLEEGPSVIATGGGALLNDGTRALIGERAVSVWLRAEIPVLMRRVRRKSDRPLLQGKDPEETLKTLLSQREPLYAGADIVITSREGPHEAVVDSIIAALERWLASRAETAHGPEAAR
ncbi:MAG: shikimate kinase [Bradyrhizobiaceae bacterium]|nr:shikimate kinase [Bradyrhizobiaceae bacterium]